MLENFWYACEFSHTINNQPKQIELWKQKIVLYRNSSGDVVALKDTCPHRGAALSLGKVEKNCIRCPYHGWKFQPDGTCIFIPANSSDVPIPNKAWVDSYPVKEKYGILWLFWGDLPPEKCPPLPTLSDFPDSSWQPVYVEIKLNVHYTRLLENLIDSVHSAFVHKNLFGSGMVKEPYLLAKDEVILEDWGGSTLIIAKQPAPKGVFWKYIYSQEFQSTKTKLGFCLPNLAFHAIDFKFKLRQFFVFVPVNDNTTILKTIQFRNFLTHPWADGLFGKIIRQIIQQDKPIVESQLPQAVPIDLTAELNVAGDALSVAYRKLRKKGLDMDKGINNCYQSLNKNR